MRILIFLLIFLYSLPAFSQLNVYMEDYCICRRDITKELANQNSETSNFNTCKNKILELYNSEDHKYSIKTFEELAEPFRSRSIEAADFDATKPFCHPQAKRRWLRAYKHEQSDELDDKEEEFERKICGLDGINKSDSKKAKNCREDLVEELTKNLPSIKARCEANPATNDRDKIINRCIKLDIYKTFTEKSSEDFQKTFCEYNQSTNSSCVSTKILTSAECTSKYNTPEANKLCNVSYSIKADSGNIAKLDTNRVDYDKIYDIKIGSEQKNVDIKGGSAGNPASDSMKVALGEDYEKCQNGFRLLMKESKINPDLKKNPEDYLKKKGCPVEKFLAAQGKNSLNEVMESYSKVEISSTQSSPAITGKFGSSSNLAKDLLGEDYEKCKTAYDKLKNAKPVPSDTDAYMKNAGCPAEALAKLNDLNGGRMVAGEGDAPESLVFAPLEDHADEVNFSTDDPKALTKEQVSNIVYEYCGCHRQYKSSLDADDYKAVIFQCIDEVVKIGKDEKRSALLEKSSKISIKPKTGEEIKDVRLVCSNSENRQGRRELKRDLAEFEEDMKRKHCTELLYKTSSEVKTCFSERVDFLTNFAELKPDFESCSQIEFYPSPRDVEMCQKDVRFSYMDINKKSELDAKLCYSKTTKPGFNLETCLAEAEKNKQYDDILECPNLSTTDLARIDWSSRDNWFDKIKTDLSEGKLAKAQDPRSLLTKDCQCRKFASSRNIKECEKWTAKFGDEFGGSCKPMPEVAFKGKNPGEKSLKEGYSFKGDWFDEMSKQQLDYSAKVQASNKDDKSVNSIQYPMDYRVYFTKETQCHCQEFEDPKSQSACIDYIARHGDDNARLQGECDVDMDGDGLAGMDENPNLGQCLALAAGRETLRALGTVLSQRDDVIGAVASVGMKLGACIPPGLMSQVRCEAKTPEDLESHECKMVIEKKCKDMSGNALLQCAKNSTISGFNAKLASEGLVSECPTGPLKTECKTRIEKECFGSDVPKGHDQVACAKGIIKYSQAAAIGNLSFNEVKAKGDQFAEQILNGDESRTIVDPETGELDRSDKFKESQAFSNGMCLAGAMVNSAKDLCIRMTKEGSKDRKNCELGVNIADAGYQIAQCLKESTIAPKNADGERAGLSPREACLIKNGANSAGNLLFGPGQSGTCFTLKDQKEKNQCLARAGLSASGDFAQCLAMGTEELRKQCMLLRAKDTILNQIPTNTPAGMAIHGVATLGTAMASCGTFKKEGKTDAMCMAGAMLPFLGDVIGNDMRCDHKTGDAKAKCLANNQTIRETVKLAQTGLQVLNYIKQCEAKPTPEDKRVCYLQNVANYLPGESGVYLKFLLAGYSDMKIKCQASVAQQLIRAGALTGTGGELFTHIYQKVKVKKLHSLYSDRNVKGGKHTGETMGEKFASNDPLDALKFAEDSKWLELDILKKQIIFENIHIVLTTAGNTMHAIEMATKKKTLIKGLTCAEDEKKVTETQGYETVDELMYGEWNDSLFAHLNKVEAPEFQSMDLKGVFYSMAGAKDDVEAMIISKDYEFTMSRSYSMTLEEYEEYKFDYQKALLEEYKVSHVKELAQNTVHLMDVVFPKAFAAEGQQPEKGKNPNFWQTTDMVASMAGSAMTSKVIMGVAASTPLGHCHAMVHKIIDKVFDKDKKQYTGKETLKMASKAAASMALRVATKKKLAQIQASPIALIITGVDTIINVKRQIEGNKKRKIDAESAAHIASNSRVEFEQAQEEARKVGGEVVMVEGKYQVSTAAKEDKEAEAQGRVPATNPNIGHPPGQGSSSKTGESP